MICGSPFPAWAARLGAACWVPGRAPLGRRRGPHLLFQECAPPLPPPQVGATWSAILRLSAGPGCCEHPYAVLLQGSGLPAITAICSHGIGPKPRARGTVPGGDWF